MSCQVTCRDHLLIGHLNFLVGSGSKVPSMQTLPLKHQAAMLVGVKALCSRTHTSSTKMRPSYRYVHARNNKTDVFICSVTSWLSGRDRTLEIFRADGLALARPESERWLALTCRRPGETSMPPRSCLCFAASSAEWQ